MPSSPSIPKPRPVRASLPRVIAIVRELRLDAPRLYDSLSLTAIDYQRRCRMAKAEARDAAPLKRKVLLA